MKTLMIAFAALSALALSGCATTAPRTTAYSSSFGVPVTSPAPRSRSGGGGGYTICDQVTSTACGNASDDDPNAY